MMAVTQICRAAPKRSSSYDHVVEVDSAREIKKLCREKSPHAALEESSSDGGNDSTDEQTSYNANQIKAKRRASSHLSLPLNLELTKAVSQYSDDDEEDTASIKLFSRKGSICSSGSPSHVSSSSSENSTRSRNNSEARNNALASDRVTRIRCFEYLVGAIDEAWASYCDMTTMAEDEALSHSTCADSTEYQTPPESDDESASKLCFGFKACQGSCSSKGSHSLQTLKDRLTKTKYYLQDLVESDDYDDIYSFWRRWDMVKYATIELVEDDDDEIVETTIEELEKGRHFVN